MSLYRPIAMNNLYLHETKHALNFSSAFCILLIYVYSWKCFWWEHRFSKERGFFLVLSDMDWVLSNYIPLIWKQELWNYTSLLENIMFIHFLWLYCLFQTLCKFILHALLAFMYVNQYKCEVAKCRIGNNIIKKFVMTTPWHWGLEE